MLRQTRYVDGILWVCTFLTFSFQFGVNRIVPLKEGGETIPVTQENKREFVQLSAQYRLYSSIKEQIEALSTGFYEVIPKDLITIVSIFFYFSILVRLLTFLCSSTNKSSNS